MPGSFGRRAWRLRTGFGWHTLRRWRFPAPGALAGWGAAAGWPGGLAGWAGGLAGCAGGFAGCAGGFAGCTGGFAWCAGAFPNFCACSSRRRCPAPAQTACACLCPCPSRPARPCQESCAKCETIFFCARYCAEAGFIAAVELVRLPQPQAYLEGCGTWQLYRKYKYSCKATYKESRSDTPLPLRFSF